MINQWYVYIIQKINAYQHSATTTDLLRYAISQNPYKDTILWNLEKMLENLVFALKIHDIFILTVPNCVCFCVTLPIYLKINLLLL